MQTHGQHQTQMIFIDLLKVCWSWLVFPAVCWFLAARACCCEMQHVRAYRHKHATNSLWCTVNSWWENHEDRVLTLYKNGSCEITQWLFETFGQERSCVISQEPFLYSVRTHFYQDASTYDRLCDRRVVETATTPIPGINRKHKHNSWPRMTICTHVGGHSLIASRFICGRILTQRKAKPSRLISGARYTTVRKPCRFEQFFTQNRNFRKKHQEIRNCFTLQTQSDKIYDLASAAVASRLLPWHANMQQINLLSVRSATAQQQQRIGSKLCPSILFSISQCAHLKTPNSKSTRVENVNKFNSVVARFKNFQPLLN